MQRCSGHLNCRAKPASKDSWSPAACPHSCRPGAPRTGAHATSNERSVGWPDPCRNPPIGGCMRAVGFQGNRPRIALVSEAQHGPGDAHGLVAKRTPFALEQYVLLSPEEQEQLNVSDVPMQGRPKCPARGLLDEEALLALPVGSKQTDAL